MNFRLPNIPPTRRLFLGVAVAVVLMGTWLISKLDRSDIQSQRVGRKLVFDNPFDQDNLFDGWPYLRLGKNSIIELGTNYMVWSFGGEGLGNLRSPFGDERLEYARSGRKDLAAVTSEEARETAYEQFPNLVAARKAGKLPAPLIIRDDEIILLRLRHETQTVYAIQATDQTGGRGHFRSRRILPAAGAGGSGSSAQPSTPASR